MQKRLKGKQQKRSRTMSHEEVALLVDLAAQTIYAQTHKSLEQVHRDILQQSLLEKDLTEIKIEGLTNNYVCTGKAQELWNWLSQALGGEQVTKRNVVGVLRGLQRRQLRSQKRKSKAKTSRNSRATLNGNKFDSKLMVLKSTLFSGAIFRVNNEPPEEPPENESEVFESSRANTALSSRRAASDKLKRFVKTGIPLFAATGLVGVWYAVSWLGNWYGAKSHLAGNIPQAQFAYNWVLKLNPWDRGAHYNLGAIYEDQQNYQLAHAQYQQAIELGLVAAYNNQARLYILEGKFDAAVSLLRVGLPLARNELTQVRYSMLKNLGWARLEQGRFDEALLALNQAITLQRNSAPAYCLLAQVAEKQGNKKAALGNWENCLGLSYQPQTPEEDIWIRIAQQRLADASEGK